MKNLKDLLQDTEFQNHLRNIINSFFSFFLSLVEITYSILKAGFLDLYNFLNTKITKVFNKNEPTTSQNSNEINHSEVSKESNQSIESEVTVSNKSYEKVKENEERLYQRIDVLEEKLELLENNLSEKEKDIKTKDKRLAELEEDRKLLTEVHKLSEETQEYMTKYCNLNSMYAAKDDNSKYRDYKTTDKEILENSGFKELFDEAHKLVTDALSPENLSHSIKIDEEDNPNGLEWDNETMEKYKEQMEEADIFCEEEESELWDNLDASIDQMIEAYNKRLGLTDDTEIEDHPFLLDMAKLHNPEIYLLCQKEGLI